MGSAQHRFQQQQFGVISSQVNSPGQLPLGLELYIYNGSVDMLKAMRAYRRLEGWLAQLGWMRALGHEGGLFVTVGRRMHA